MLVEIIYTGKLIPGDCLKHIVFKFKKKSKKSFVFNHSGCLDMHIKKVINKKLHFPIWLIGCTEGCRLWGCGFLSDRTTKVRVPPPPLLNLSGSWGFGHFFIDRKKVFFFVVQGVLLPPPFLVVGPLQNTTFLYVSYQYGKQSKCFFRPLKSFKKELITS